jgi:Domain of unknown function (DUF4082)
MALVSSRVLFILSTAICAGCSFAVEPVDANVGDLKSPQPADDLGVPDLAVGEDLAHVDLTKEDLICAFACNGVACGQSGACGTCCIGSGCSPVSCDPQCSALNSCGSGCQSDPENTSCIWDMGAGFCRSGLCSNQAAEFTVFGNQTTTNAVLNGAGFELGLKFTLDRAASAVRLRFFKPTGAGAGQVGHLWDGTGTLLATAAFTSETASGWQEVPLPSPMPLVANHTYVVSYSTSTTFAGDLSFFNAGLDAPPLHVPASGGVYQTSTGSFPTQTFDSSNYWADIVVR